ncbi:MAG: type II CRISPR-associated endonuclease Cas1 [Chitinispirillia bacterium]|nr:type II CRISPR-associated endonuclease Cas1 [Chitinispirillia bacterium]MCL2268113.1 type II CRISPR-associated endonuclease Cas1 [Chitinispirillia bacterium]
MIKQTLYFGNPAYLSTKNGQIVIKTDDTVTTRPIEDIGIVILDDTQITITQSTITKLLENNVAFIHCNEKHMPVGMLLNLDGNTLQRQRFQKQIEASEPLKKQLWLQTVQAKIKNQASLLSHLGKDIKRMNYLQKSVKSGDPNNREAQAASYYWKHIFEDHIPDFSRSQDGPPPNNILNYGYAILRAAMARALVGTGLLPTLGIFHRNQYNAYCLADDIMEPYRPCVDYAVIEYIAQHGIPPETLCPKFSKHFLTVLQTDVYLGKERSPLLVALTRTSASLLACFQGKKRKILYPELNNAFKKN